jgi:hypothetical protein
MFPCYSHLSHLDQTYLSQYEGDGAYGHIALGRSFALEMGVVIPTSNQRLGKKIARGIPYIETKSLSKDRLIAMGWILSTSHRILLHSIPCDTSIFRKYRPSISKIVQYLMPMVSGTYRLIILFC